MNDRTPRSTALMPGRDAAPHGDTCAEPTLAAHVQETPDLLANAHTQVTRLEDALFGGGAAKCDDGSPPRPSGLFTAAAESRELAANLVKRLQELCNRVGG